MLSDEQFKNGVENCDGQVKPWNQDQMVDGRVYMHHGACAQLAAMWIRNRKLRATAQQVPGILACTEEVSWMCEQKYKGRANEVIEEFLRAHGVRKDSGQVVFTRNFNLDAVNLFIRAKKAYYLAGAVGGDSGHGIAFDTTGVTPQMFDPNYGTAGFPTLDDMARLFKAYWPRAYADLNGQGFVARYY